MSFDENQKPVFIIGKCSSKESIPEDIYLCLFSAAYLLSGGGKLDDRALRHLKIHLKHDFPPLSKWRRIWRVTLKIDLTGTLPEPNHENNTYEIGEWFLTTKYYTCDIQVALVSQPFQLNDLAVLSEAICLCFNPENTDSFLQVKQWVPFIEDLQVDVRLLVCRQVLDHHSVSRKQVVEWCLENQFELVELEPGVDHEEDDDVCGMQRIRSALQAHTWSTLKLKDKSTPRAHHPGFLNAGAEEPSHSSATNGGNFKVSPNISSPSSASDGGSDSVFTAPENSDFSHSSSDFLFMKPDGLMDPNFNFNIDDEDLEAGEPSFETLFSQLMMIKEKAKNLQDNDRKRMAEQMTLQFWRAIGGSDDEINGLSSDNQS